MYEEKSYVEKWESLCDDPTVEESIECVFEHQLEDGLEMCVEDDVNSKGADDDESCADDKKYYTSGKLVQVGSYAPFPNSRVGPRETSYRPTTLNKAKSGMSTGTDDSSSSSIKPPEHTCDNCKDGTEPFINLPPQEWPQYPLLLRPTPGSGTNIIGVRYANSTEYLTEGTCEHQWWKEIPTGINATQSQSFCAKCCCLPINNGNEAMGRTLVIDFESSLFQGTLQLRIRRTNGTTPEPYDDSHGYFSGLNRTYQCVLQGRFKVEGIPMTQCFTGQAFDGLVKPPAPSITKGAIRIMNFFAPRLQAKFDGKKPYILSPLGSTPQTVKVDAYTNDEKEGFRADATISDAQEEPVEDSTRLIPLSGKMSNSSSSVIRAKARKKAFDKLCGDGNASLTFQTDRAYTFEFLQHLVDFGTFELSLGSILGKYNLSSMMNGQPLKIMAGYQLPTGDQRGGVETLENLWSFDVWHENSTHAMRKNAETSK